MVTSNTLYSNEQIAQVAINNGFPANNPQALIVCVSIARAESGGNVSVTSPPNSNGTLDKGLWQINTVHDDKLPGQDRLDPNVNAKLMMMISNGGTNWQPWSTYNNGAYQKFMNGVTKDLANKQLVPNGTTPGGTGTANNLLGIPGTGATDAVVDFIKMLADIRTWIRIGEVLLGGAFISFGIIMLLKESSTVKQAVRAGLTAIPGGAAVKGAGMAARGASVAKGATIATTANAAVGGLT